MRQPSILTLRAFKEVRAIAARYDGLFDQARKRFSDASREGGRRQGICGSTEQRTEFRLAKAEFKRLYQLSAALNRLKKVLNATFDDMTPERIQRLQQAVATVYALVYCANSTPDKLLAYQVTFFRWPTALWEVVDPTGSLREMRMQYFQGKPGMLHWMQSKVAIDKPTKEQLTPIFDELTDSQKTAVLFKFMEAWKSLPDVAGAEKPSFEVWVQGTINRTVVV